MEHRDIDVAWAAGLFEGEGSIVIDGNSTRLQMNLTDEDVIRRLGDVLGGSVTGPYSYPTQTDGSERKPFWAWRCRGEQARRAAREMEPYLGKRRRARLAAIGLLDQPTLDL